MKDKFLMMICAGLLLQPASAAVVLVTSAAALSPTDSINWSVLGPAGSTFANPTSSFTGAGNGFTVSKELAGNFQRADSGVSPFSGSYFSGFALGTPLIWTVNSGFSSNDLSIVFDGPVAGAGAVIFPNVGVNSNARVRAFDSSNNLLGQATISNVYTDGGAGKFIGLLSDSADIKRISFAITGQSFSASYYLGNVSIAESSPVPEPSTYALLGASLLGLGLLRRKR
jgi:hypothetical protein